MNITDIQERLDALAVAMAAKALVTPSAEYTTRSNAEGYLALWWNDQSKHKFFHGELDAALAEAEAFVAALPSPEEARMKAFLNSLSETIELGKKGDIDVAFVNPLLAMMQRLSKNALTHQGEVAA